MVNWVYDLVLWSFSLLVDLFFREVHPRNAYRIPRRGPIIFVAAPHANQFVDPLILMRAVRLEAHRRVSFLTAEKSMRRKFIGFIARCGGSVPVARAMDMVKPGKGTIFWPNPDKPLEIQGKGTQFTKDAEVGGQLLLPTVGKTPAVSTDIAEIVDNEHIILKHAFEGPAVKEQLTGEGTKYKIAPKVDQTIVYEAVFHRLHTGGCIGIFPEGGSHDRTELLPLKAGVAIMALGALQKNPDCGLTIVPVGMNYFHAHKFRSRAVIEFGSPIEIPKELVDQYSRGERREAIKTLLGTVYNALRAVTVTSPDYETLMVIQAARRLYKPSQKKLPLPYVVELNRRLIKGYETYKDEPRVKQLRESVAAYNKQLRLLGLRDHQVEYAKFSVPKVVLTLVYRAVKLVVLAFCALPGFILFSPVFAATKIISHRKAKEALKGSTVKVQGRDVIATWKLLVSLGVAPVVYQFYVFLLCFLTYKHRFYGIIPEWVPMWLLVIVGWIVFPTITFAALRFGEIGMDIFKSLKPLAVCLTPSGSNTLIRLRERRQKLAEEVTDLINTHGPELYPDFDSARIVSPSIIRTETASSSFHPTTTSPPHHLSPYQPFPKDESFTSLSNIGLFASRPSSRGRSRSGSENVPLSTLRSLTVDDASLDEVSRKIRGALAERRRRRARKSEGDGDWAFGSETEESQASMALDEDDEEAEYEKVGQSAYLDYEGKKDI